ncbi:MAG: single-stranded-DNA-specific exonuclease RecJ [Verrucomicrobiales bacterium]
MRSEPRWILPPAVDPPLLPGYPRLVAEILHRRGIQTPDAFLRPRLQDLRDPFLLRGLDKAVARLLAAVDKGERVTLYGDYDVDGVSSLALLRSGLAAYGVQASVTLPHRMEEGYGLSEDGLARCLEETNPSLVVAVDCGTTSSHEALWLAERGVDLIVLDHHEAAPEGMPACAAIVNPKVSGEQPYLCSAGVVFKVIHGLLKTRPLDRSVFDLKAHLDLVALATVADIVPLVDENRLLVRHGLAELARTNRPGLVALKKLAGLNGKMVASDIGFRLGPRLNAAGRLDTARHAFDLLAAADETTADELAGLLDDHNRERQQLEQEVFQQALAQAEILGDVPAFVLSGDSWHPGVVGIVASRIARHFHRPAFVIGFDDNRMGKGSARSIAGISLTNIIHACRDRLVKGGGHDMAAGITIRHEEVEGFREAVTAHVAAIVDPSVFHPVIAPDAVVRLEELNDALLDAWKWLSPFGQGFGEPLLVVRGVEPSNPPRVLKEKHYKIPVRQGRGFCDAIWFGGATRGPLPAPPWDVVFHLEANEWNGRRSPQMRVSALRSSDPNP